MSTKSSTSDTSRSPTSNQTAVPSRPARTSRLGAVLAALCGTVLLIALMGQYQAGLVGVAAGALLAALTTLVESDRRLTTIAASLLVMPTTVVIALAFVLPVVHSSTTLPLTLPVNTAILFSAFGAGTILTGALGNRAVYRTAKVSGAVLLVPALTTGILLLGHIDAVFTALTAAMDTITTLADRWIAPPVAYPELGGFLLLYAIATRAVASSGRTLPIVQLVDREDRADVRDRLDRLVGLSSSTAKIAAIVGILLLVVELAGGMNILLGIVPPLALTALITNLPVVRGLFILVAIVLFTVTWAVKALKWAVDQQAHQTARHAVRVLGGGLLVTALGLVFAQPITDRALEELPSMLVAPSTSVLGMFSPRVVVLGLIAASLGAFVLLLVGISMLGGMGFFSDRSASGAVASGSLLGGALFASLLGGNQFFLFATVVLGIVTWDVSAYGATVVSELGTDVPTYRPEVVHATATLLVGVVAIAVVYLGMNIGFAAPDGPRVVISVVAAAFGAVFLAAILRG